MRVHTRKPANHCGLEVGVRSPDSSMIREGVRRGKEKKGCAYVRFLSLCKLHIHLSAKVLNPDGASRPAD